MFSQLPVVIHVEFLSIRILREFIVFEIILNISHMIPSVPVISFQFNVKYRYPKIRTYKQIWHNACLPDFAY